MCFVWIWEQTAIISLYSINWLVFITETECVYCAVRTEFSLLCDLRRLRVRSHQFAWDLCRKEWVLKGEGTVFFSQYFGFPLSLSFHKYSILILIYILYFQKDDRAKARNALISDTVSEIEEDWIASSFTLFLKSWMNIAVDKALLNKLLFVLKL